MAYNRFFLTVVLHVMILIITIFLCCYLMLEFRDRNKFFILLVLFSAVTVQVISLIHYVTLTNRELSRFLMVMKNSDYSVKFSDKKLDRSFKELALIMDKTIESLRELRFQKEVQVHLLKIITAEIKTGILSVNDEGQIVLMNRKANKVLGVEDIQTWGQLRTIRPSFVKEVDSMGAEGNKFADIMIDTESFKLSVSLITIGMADEKVKIITFEDIGSQVEVKESDAWLKLIRTLMHEMMNSLTPLTSLTETLANILSDKALSKEQFSTIAEEDIEDIRFCLENIQKRKVHLQTFVENYHRLSRLPLPEKQSVFAYDLVNAVVCCLQTELNNLEVTIQIDPDLRKMILMVDSSQIEQVLINVVKNSMQAIQDSTPRNIQIKGKETESNSVVEISDTGVGIPPEHLEDIFVPFYTTKENGSGIGLGLSRQIMLAHNGFIRVRSEVGKGSTFSLWFEKNSQHG